MNERCNYCGSWALEETAAGRRCRDCWTEGPAILFTDFARRNDERLDQIAYTYSGIVVACYYGPPNPMDPFVQKVAEEMRGLGRRWKAGEANSTAD